MGGRGKTVVVQMTIERDIKESIFKKDIEERHFKSKKKYANKKVEKVLAVVAEEAKVLRKF